MMDDYSPEPKWYVAHTYSGYENKVMEDIKKIVENRGLQDVVTDVRIPMLVTVEMDGDVEKIHENKLFPSYVLVKMVMNDFTWHIVRNIRGVTGFVGPGSKPVALTDAEVAQWGLEPEGEAEPVVKKSTLGFAVGDTVKVKEGVMLGITEVKVLEISSDEQKITCSAFMFGRETVVELDASDVAPIE
jgi:transcriptional antiterminator NusG